MAKAPGWHEQKAGKQCICEHPRRPGRTCERGADAGTRLATEFASRDELLAYWSICWPVRVLLQGS